MDKMDLLKDQDEQVIDKSNYQAKWVIKMRKVINPLDKYG